MCEGWAVDEPRLLVITARLAVLDALMIELDNQHPDNPGVTRIHAEASGPIDRWIRDHGESAAAAVLPAAMHSVLGEVVKLADALAVLGGHGVLATLLEDLRRQIVAEIAAHNLEDQPSVPESASRRTDDGLGNPVSTAP